MSDLISRSEAIEATSYENATTEERTVAIKLSDTDCEKIYNLCGEYSITISGLLQGFIGDLIDGTYTNGSDERMCARNYFERCWFTMFPEQTLLRWLLSMGYDVYDDFLEVIDNIETAYAEMEYYKKDPSVFGEGEIDSLKEDIKIWEERIMEIKTDFLKNNKEANWEKEVHKVNEWWKEKQHFINNDKSEKEKPEKK